MGDERIVRGNMSKENWKDGFYQKNKQGTVSQEFLKYSKLSVFVARVLMQNIYFLLSLFSI